MFNGTWGRTTNGGSQQGATPYDVSTSALVGRCSARKRCVYFGNFAWQWQLEVKIDNDFNYIEIAWYLNLMFMNFQLIEFYIIINNFSEVRDVWHFCDRGWLSKNDKFSVKYFMDGARVELLNCPRNWRIVDGIQFFWESNISSKDFHWLSILKHCSRWIIYEHYQF